MITREQIEEKIRSLGWDVNGTAETNDMIRLADWVQADQSNLLAEVKRLRDEYQQIWLKLLTENDKLIIDNMIGRLNKITTKQSNEEDNKNSERAD